MRLLDQGEALTLAAELLTAQGSRTGPRALLQGISRVKNGVPPEEAGVDETLFQAYGQRLEEPYLTETTHLEGDVQFPVTVPPDCFFVLGDNRNHSQDSRSSTLGCVPRGDIEGRAFFRFAPLERFGPIE